MMLTIAEVMKNPMKFSQSRLLIKPKNPAKNE